MARAIQITVDAAGPRELAEFWCEVLGYVEQPPPPGCETWEAALTELVALGATHVGEFDEPEGHWITLLDPEGNEFCLH